VDDAAIMQRVCAGEHELFDELVRRYRDALLKVAASKLGSRDRAEDVVQEAFLAAFKARDSYKPRFAFRTWLWTILLNLCRRHLKQAARRAETIAAGANLADEPVGHRAAGGVSPVVTDVMLAERRRELERLLEELPEAEADALRLRFFGQLKFQEIAHSMGCSLGAAKNRVRRGLTSLAERLRSPEESP
jgi:RNA polymerase sigma-70 factor (ECF subfamily)